MPAAKQRLPMQQVTVEFRVVGDIDGVTLAPAVVLDPSNPDYNEPDDRGIHVVDVPGDLGIIDPDLLGEATQGDRCVPWVYLDTNGLGGLPSSRIVVLDNVERDDGVVVPRAQFTRFSTGGVPLYYSDLSTWVPQGSAIGIAGYSGVGIKTIRLNIVAPRDAEEFAAMLDACCCSATPCEDPPEVDDIDVDRLMTPGSEEVTFDVTGGDFDESGVPPTVWLVQESDSEREDEYGGAVQGVFVSQVPGTSVTCRFDTPADAVPGTYHPVISNGLSPPCSNAEQEDIPTLLLWPSGCPVMDDPQAGAPATISIDGGAQNFTVAGEGFAGPSVQEIRLVSQTSGDDMSTVSFVTDSDVQLTVTANPQTAEGDVVGLYDIVMVPVGPACPTQRVLGVLQVLVS